MPINRFFNELKRRNVYRVAVTYAVVSWLLIQIVSVIVPIIEAPAWLSKVVLILLIVCFPIALILAWAYEMTPKGIIRTTSASIEKEPGTDQKKSRTSNLLIGILLFIIAAQYVYNNIYTRSESQEESPAMTNQSIAVLPLINLNSKDENLEYFSDGVTQEIIDELAKIRSISVAAFTTTIFYKNSNKSQTEIAEELDVNYLIWGSVGYFEPCVFAI